jgi:hypothetical protein
MTLQNAPPGLDYERDRRFSKVVPILSVGYQLLTIYVVSYSRLCSSVYLSKEAFSVLTSHLKNSFFKNAKPPELTIKNILSGLPPLWDRVKALQVCCLP